MKISKHAIRRHHQYRLKIKRSRYGHLIAMSTKEALRPVTNNQQTGMVYATPCKCSCWMCGNQRKFEGISYQEKKALHNAVLELEVL